MLELLDLRTRRERLEPRRLEIDPSVEQTVREIVARVRDEGDAALLHLTLRFEDHFVIKPTIQVLGHVDFSVNRLMFIDPPCPPNLIIHCLKASC